MTREAEIALALRAQQGDLQARNVLIEAGLPLVKSVARRYRGRGLPFEDLVDEGVLGLVASIPRFDAARGPDFMCFASFRVMRAMGRALKSTASTVRLPELVVRQLERVRRARGDLRQWLGRDPTEAEIALAVAPDADSVVASLAEALGRPPEREEVRAELRRRRWSPRVVRRILDCDAAFRGRRRLASLDALRIDPPDRAAAEADAALLAEEARGRINAALAGLDPRSESIVRLRWGLARRSEHAPPGFPPGKRFNGAKLTLTEIGSLFGLCRERVRQIEAEAYRHLERSLARAEPSRGAAPRYWDGGRAFAD